MIIATGDCREAPLNKIITPYFDCTEPQMNQLKVLFHSFFLSHKEDLENIFADYEETRAYAELIDDWLYDEINNTFNTSALLLKDGAIQSLKNKFKQLISEKMNGSFPCLSYHSHLLFFLLLRDIKTRNLKKPLLLYSNNDVLLGDQEKFDDDALTSCELNNVFGQNSDCSLVDYHFNKKLNQVLMFNKLGCNQYELGLTPDLIVYGTGA